MRIPRKLLAAADDEDDELHIRLAGSGVAMCGTVLPDAARMPDLLSPLCGGCVTIIERGRERQRPVLVRAS